MPEMIASPDERVYDYAILGAGVSGLSLAWCLDQSSLAERSILLVDGARDDDELRTLSFWARGPIACEALVRHRWQRLRLHPTSDATDEVPLREHEYRTLFFADLQRETKARLGRRPQHRIIEGRARDLAEAAGCASFTVDGISYRARWVFDSRFTRRELVVDTRRWHHLQQHFYGWIVRAPREAFDPRAATFFDFRVPTDPESAPVPRGSAFFYVLPFSAREALVELVTLDAVEAEPILRAYLADAYHLDAIEILDREAGVSPLTEQPFAWRQGERVRRIGIAAGRLKSSTGYALVRILDDSAAIVSSLERHGHPFAPPADSRWFRWLDAIFLEIWDADPGAIPAIFAALFRRNPADRVLRFLDERASLSEVLRLGMSLPKAPFVRAIGRLLGRRITGRARPLPPSDPPRALPP